MVSDDRWDELLQEWEDGTEDIFCESLVSLPAARFVAFRELLWLYEDIEEDEFIVRLEDIGYKVIESRGVIV